MRISALLIALLATTAYAASATLPEARFRALCAQAASAPTAQDAEKLVAEAEQILKLHRHMRGLLQYQAMEAELVRCRGLIHAKTFRRDAQNADARLKALVQFQNAVKRYTALRTRCEAESERRETMLGTRDPAKDKIWQEITARATSTTYFLAWTHYSQALLTEPGEPRTKLLNDALLGFATFTADGYRQHPIVIDCFLGQAKCLLELGRHAQVPRLLADATAENTPVDQYRRLVLVLCRAHAAAGSHMDVETTAKTYFDTLPAGHKHNVVELDLMLDRARSLAKLVKLSPKYGSRWRARLDNVTRVLYRYGPKWRADLRAALGDDTPAGPFISLVAAREHFEAKRFKEALAELEKGLAAADQATDAAIRTDLLHTRAASHLNLKMWPEAYESASSFAQEYPKDARAATMCGYAFQAAFRSAPVLQGTPYANFLAYARKQFPDEPALLRADWHRARVLIDAEKYTAAGQVLSGIPKDSPAHLEALYGLVIVAWKHLEKAAPAPDAAKARQRIAPVEQAITRFLDDWPAKPTAAQRKLAKTVSGVATAVGEQLVQLPKPDCKAAGKLLDATNAVHGADKNMAMRRKALRIQILVLGGADLTTAAKLVDELLGAQADAGQAARALARIADPLERAQTTLRDSAQPDRAQELDQRLARIYSFLHAHLAKESAAASKASRIAVRRRLAACRLRLGEHKVAEAHYQWLVGNVPREESADALRGLALAQEALGRNDESAKNWAKLCRGVEKGTPPWYEAQYGRIDCLQKSGDDARARKHLALFKLQHPTVTDKHWRAKFDDLSKHLVP